MAKHVTFKPYEITVEVPDGENLLALQSRPETIWSQKKKTDAPKTYATGMAGIVGTLTTAMPVRR